MGMFEVKVRQVGSSLGVLIPKEIADAERIGKNQTIKVIIMKKDPDLVEKFFGIAKGAGRFKRDNHGERVF